MAVLRKKIILLLVLFSVGLFGYPRQASSTETKRTASQFSTFKVYSEILKEERTMIISLPEGYDSGEISYPVLYSLDAEGGDNFPGSVATLKALNAMKIAPRMIVVGIHNTNRNRDMIPDSVAHRPGSGGAPKFLDFISDELMPYVRKNFRTRDFSALYGMSNSALFVVYALLEKPEAFQAYIASSPMIGHCPEYIDAKAKAFFKSAFAAGRMLYMIYGTEDSPRVTAFVPGFQENLVKYAPEGFNSKLEILDGEGHVPKSSLERGLTFVFSRRDKKSSGCSH